MGRLEPALGNCWSPVKAGKPAGEAGGQCSDGRGMGGGARVQMGVD